MALDIVRMTEVDRRTNRPWCLEESTEWMHLVRANRGSSLGGLLDSRECVTSKGAQL
jgi:hypothetical protein